MSGRFLVLEGVEGAGKSTQLEVVRSYLEAQGHRVRMTREPGGTVLGEKVRDLLLDPANVGMTPDMELLLVFAARAQHIARCVRPALEAGQWVVSDRFTDATFAYQGAGRGVPASRIEALEQLVQGDLRPDRVLLLDIPPAEGARRVLGRGEADRFERERQEFFERVREAYLARASRWPQRYRVVDASGSIDAVSRGVRSALDGLQSAPGE